MECYNIENFCSIQRKEPDLMNSVSPSILAANFANLTKDINKVQNADMLHIDVMDGHFVPNISIGVPVISAIRKSTTMFLDVHLMITDPLFNVDAFAKSGADLICFHIETGNDTYINNTINCIKEKGKQVALALKPGTEAVSVFPYLPRLDMVLVMTVEPGFGGQTFMPDMVNKIATIRAEAVRKGLNLAIQVDGGINSETASECIHAGATVLVAGSYIFGAQNPSEIVAQLQNVT